jgi:hypothetical protein
MKKTGEHVTAGIECYPYGFPHMKPGFLYVAMAAAASKMREQLAMELPRGMVPHIDARWLRYLADRIEL